MKYSSKRNIIQLSRSLCAQAQFYKTKRLPIIMVTEYTYYQTSHLTHPSPDNLDIPTWVEGAALASSTRKLNRLKMATKMAMSMSHDKKQKPPSGKHKSLSR